MSRLTMQTVASLPQDFPRADLVREVLSNYEMCSELVAQIVAEVRKEQLRSPLISTPEIVEMRLDLARRFGWGCFPGELEWIFRNVVRELGCDMPSSLVP
ncbi:hypothetical protein [Noviherbaspirillum pedocola]|uniref:Uncharacterized protein n=1 Tax=Noviherbaspirillum pedocola TaxID=2801341 RepID=A0A934T0V0_9BURK|nr:hypothetical protein [Noviherbaspirillum pedocola]MBK4735338.1 hypothetical protein [Noviherbaspirillum pedocola]